LRTESNAPQELTPKQQDLLAVHVVKRQLRGLFQRGDERLEAGFLASCRRDHTWYDASTGLEIHEITGDKLGFFGYNHESDLMWEAGMYLCDPVFDKSFSGTHVKRGGVSVDTPNERDFNVREYLRWRGWMDQTLDLGAGKVQHSLMVPPYRHCESCPNQLSCHGMNVV
jgi:hypothetical protein